MKRQVYKLKDTAQTDYTTLDTQNLHLFVDESEESGGGATPVNYSTDEIDTGAKWINGKPIYRKVVPFTLPDGISESAVAFDLSTLNTEIVIKNEAKLFDDNDQWIDEQIKITASNITNFYSRVNFPNILEIAFLTTEIITGNVTVNQAGMSGHVILEYTKTTD